MDVRVISYDPRYRAEFASLNYEWIETFFEIEPEDRKALDNPEGYALAKGGQIFFVLEGDDAVGTVAMVPVSGTATIELAKMAVRPDRQGRGYSRLLMDACIDFARGSGAEEIMLVSNDSLGPAMGLYHATGFIQSAQYQDPRYVRGNVEMRLQL